MRKSFTIVAILMAMVVPALADSSVNGLVSAVVRQGRDNGWSQKETPYVAVDVGKVRYVCRLSDGKQMSRSTVSSPSGGVAGTWAEVGIVTLDRSMKPVGQGASWLMRSAGGSWKLAATNEGVGYTADALRKAGVPQAIVKKLKLSLAE